MRGRESEPQLRLGQRDATTNQPPRQVQLCLVIMINLTYGKLLQVPNLSNVFVLLDNDEGVRAQSTEKPRYFCLANRRYAQDLLFIKEAKRLTHNESETPMVCRWRQDMLRQSHDSFSTCFLKQKCFLRQRLSLLCLPVLLLASFTQKSMETAVFPLVANLVNKLFIFLCCTLPLYDSLSLSESYILSQPKWHMGCFKLHGNFFHTEQRPE